MVTPAGQRPESGDRGYALLLALLVMTLLSAAAFLVLAQIHLRLSSALDESRNVHLRVLVDSGVAVALDKIQENRSFEGRFQQAMNRGIVRCTVSTPRHGRRQVEIVAEYGGETRTYLAEIAVPRRGQIKVLGLRIVPVR